MIRHPAWRHSDLYDARSGALSRQVHVHPWRAREAALFRSDFASVQPIWCRAVFSLRPSGSMTRSAPSS